MSLKIFTLCVCLALSLNTTLFAQKGYTQYVNPLIGTASHGHTYPGATRPFGMVQLSPDTGNDGWDWCSGYHYSDSSIVGFSHTHLSGTGIGDMGDILIMPVVGKLMLREGDKKNPDTGYRCRFSHKRETARPGYYSAFLEDYNIQAELTATERCGFHRYQFPASDNAYFIIDLQHGLGWDKPTETYLKIESDTVIVGYRKSSGWAKKQEVYFVLKSSIPISKFFLYNEDANIPDAKEVTGKAVKSVCYIKADRPQTLLLKVGISATSIDGARLNLDKEIPNWDFDRVREDTERSWENELSKIRVESSDPALKETFYTSMYHAFLAPTLYNDVDGSYRGPDGKIHRDTTFNNMTTFSLWDTFRAAHPLYTIVQTKRIHDMAASMMAFYSESGLLPEWSLMANETNTMIGYHAVPVLFDAYNKGLIEKPEEVYVAMKKSAQQKRFGIEYIDKYGYVPGDLVTESTSKTLEYAYDDWCIAGMAKALGHEEDYSYYSKRAQNYKNVFDPSVGFMRGRLSDGGWRSPFAPNKAEHRKGDFTEGNSWQYSWFVPHNVPDLINLMGGAERFVERLDSLFSTSSDVGTEASPDVSGLIGQYAHGNEPSHHIAYLFAMAGYPEKTQEILNRIMTTLYSNKTDGLCGNEDCGQMSAWFVLSALGFYPVNPASGQYIFGRPFFQEAQIPLNNGKTFVIKTKNLTSDSIYIRSVTLNGKSWNKGYINHSDIINGGELVFEMSNSPNKH